MNLPGIVKKSFEELRNLPEFASILNGIINQLAKLTDPLQRAKFIHQEVDKYNSEVFSHPLVKSLSPCKMGCSACCHTQVSVNEDEALLFAQRVREGIDIDHERLKLQMGAKNDYSEFYKLNYEERKCVFLDDHGSCRVYEDRPSVCRTNAVLGEPQQCDTSITVSPTRLVKTPKSDMVIYASYLTSKSSGTLPLLVGELIGVTASSAEKPQ